MTTAAIEKSAPSLWTSGIFLVLANILPIFGVFFWDWQVIDIVALYWAENLIIGFYNALRIACIRSDPSPGAESLEKAFMIPFFLVHYGGFCAGHGIFLYTFLGKHAGFTSPIDAISLIFGPLKWALLALAVSHGFSFFWNFLRGGEYKKKSVSQQMFAPYARIAALHIAIIFGGIVVQAAGQPIFLLLILVVGKTVVDLKMHFRSHKEKKKKEDSPGETA